MSGGVKLTGIGELRRFFTDAPKHVRDEGMPIVIEETEQAARDYAAGLPQKSGRLVRGVKTSYPARTSVLVGVVSSTAPHGAIVNGGTEQRRTASGANRGRMPALPSQNRIETIAPKRRARMYRRFADLLRGMGLEVSGV